MPAVQPDASALALIEVFRKAHEVVLAQTITAILRGNLGTEAQRRQQLAMIERTLARLERQAAGHVDDALARPYGAASIAVDLAFGFSAKRFRFAGVHQDAVIVAVEALRGRLSQAIVNVGRHVDDVFRQVQLEHAAVGEVVASTRRDTSRRMAADLRARGITAFVDRAGRRWSLERYTAMTVRTNSREMASAATVTRLVQNGDDLLTISKHRSPCDLCRPFEGKTYSASGRDARYPEMVALPPFHPNCLHVAHPSRTTFDDFERDLFGADVPDFESGLSQTELA